MHHGLLFVPALIVSTSALAFPFQDEAAQSEPAPDAAPVAAAAPVDPEQVKAAEALLDEVAAAYVKAPTLSDTLKMTFVSPMGPEEDELEIRLGAGTDAVLSTSGVTISSVGDQMYFEPAGIEDKFFQVPLEKDLATTMDKHFGGGLPAHFILRAGRDRSEIISALTMGMLSGATIAGHELGKNDAGESKHTIMLTGADGKAWVDISPTTKLIQEVRMELRPQGMPGDMVITSKMTSSPVVAETLAKPIAFDARGRTPVSTLEELQPPEPVQVAVGEKAPDFSLQTLEGETISLSALTGAGNVVVLDFWATWCGPCKRGLPYVSEFAQWAADSGKPIKVYGVNVWERFKADQKHAKVAEWWNAQKFAMKTLMDEGDKTAKAFGFGGIPATFVIAPDGTIAAVHNGIPREGPEQIVTQLKDEAEQALGAKAGG